jgi:GrpB-like predicted nucleotidyltransferase (UPF0157 family)
VEPLLGEHLARPVEHIGSTPVPGLLPSRSSTCSRCSPSVAHRTHHLRANAEDREEYAAIKRRLAAADDEDRIAYRTGKAPFIASVLKRIAPGT